MEEKCLSPVVSVSEPNNVIKGLTQGTKVEKTDVRQNKSCTPVSLGQL